jgi:plasmid stability protein
MPTGVIAPTRSCLHNVSMPNLLVRDLPDDVHAALQRRAQHRGQSLQQFLTAELSRLAERPNPEEVLDRIERRHGGRVGLHQAVADLGQDRERR